MKRILLALAIAVSFALSANAEEWRKVSSAWVRVDGGPAVTLVDYTATQSAWTILANCTSGSAAPLFVVPNGSCLGNWLSSTSTTTAGAASTNTIPVVASGVAAQVPATSIAVPLCRTVTPVDITSVAGETLYYSCAIPQSALTATATLHTVMVGDFLYNHVNTDVWEWKIYVGCQTNNVTCTNGVKVYDSTTASASLNVSATRGPQRVTFDLYVMSGAANAQVYQCFGDFILGSEANAVTGVGALANSAQSALRVYNSIASSAIDSTAGITYLVVTVTPTHNENTVSMKLFAGYTQYFP